jgi:hypothetical protein
MNAAGMLTVSCRIASIFAYYPPGIANILAPCYEDMDLLRLMQQENKQ